MKKSIRVALAQINTIVGDLETNLNKIVDKINQAKKHNVDIIAFPELAVSGYPPEDLLLKPQFIKDNIACVNQIAKLTDSITVILGFNDFQQELRNAAAVLHNGEWIHTYHKIHLPNYGVFDEKRYFKAGDKIPVFDLENIKFGLNICEDIWVPNSVTEKQVYHGGAEIIINISSSPYHKGKVEEREHLLIAQAKRNYAVICYINLIGGQDELVFDGNSLIINENGKIIARGNQFEEDFIVYDIDVTHLNQLRHDDDAFSVDKVEIDNLFPVETIKLSPIFKTEKGRPTLPAKPTLKLEPLAEIYHALVLGTRDYVRKNGFKTAVLGLSGGIDSALTAVIACDAIGPENVIGVSMPSQYSSPGSITDAEKLAGNLGIKFLQVPIKDTFAAYKNMLNDIFKGCNEDITEENIQARIRGNIIMALSNKFGYLPLTTGNKSEISVGYCTLYGDMAGGFAVIKDVPKTTVYELAEFCNREKERIPKSTITKPPSAELRPDQKDEDSLPPYEILDHVLEMYVEKDYDFKMIVNAGYDPVIVKKVIDLVDRSEYKRRQAPPGVKITPRAFGKDRRIPITNRYRG